MVVCRNSVCPLCIEGYCSNYSLVINESACCDVIYDKYGRPRSNPNFDVNTFDEDMWLVTDGEFEEKCS